MVAAGLLSVGEDAPPDPPSSEARSTERVAVNDEDGEAFIPSAAEGCPASKFALESGPISSFAAAKAFD